MQAAERTGAPALGNAVGYFAALYLIDKVDWLTSDNAEIAVAPSDLKRVTRWVDSHAKFVSHLKLIN